MANTVVIQQGSGQHNLLLRFLWFVFVGWWLTGLMSAIAWICVISIIGLPLGAYLLNRIPVFVTLRQRSKTWVADSQGGVTFLRQVNVAQRPISMRAIWLVLVGWWALAIWLFVAWIACILVLSLPVGLWMYNRAPAVATLMRY